MTRHPDGYHGQGGKLYRRKSTLIVEHARKLIAEGKPVTQGAIMKMLDKERPKHRTFPTEISRALKSIPKENRPRQGHSVKAEGVVYPSMLAAARAKDVAMETVRKRITSPNCPKWKRLD
ncbi:hypothetical protein ACWX0K_14780 [Nitrobacteraceae bacterium UC4446_H13]